MENRLKLYNDIIRTYIEHSDKAKFRKIAFSHKMTVSEFNRYLIRLVIKLDESNKLNSKLEVNEKNLDELVNSIGGIFNHK